MSSRKEELLKELQELENEDVGQPEETEDLGESIEAEKIEEVVEEPVVEKKKKPRTTKQLEALEKGRKKAKENADQRRKQRESLAKQKQIELEEKLVKKAIAVKKKQIKAQQILDDISDDDTPVESIRRTSARIKRQNLPPPRSPSPPPLQYFFI